MRGDSMVLVVTAFLAAPVAGYAQVDAASSSSRARPGQPAWLQEVQTYSMLPAMPEHARRLHVSVNGVWAGIGSEDPILVLNTGSGLKDVKAAMQAVPAAPIIKPTLEALKKIL